MNFDRSHITAEFLKTCSQLNELGVNPIDVLRMAVLSDPQAESIPALPLVIGLNRVDKLEELFKFYGLLRNDGVHLRHLVTRNSIYRASFLGSRSIFVAIMFELQLGGAISSRTGSLKAWTLCFNDDQGQPMRPGTIKTLRCTYDLDPREQRIARKVRMLLQKWEREDDLEEGLVPESGSD